MNLNFYNFLYSTDEIKSASDKSRFLTVYVDLRKHNSVFLHKDKLIEVINYVIAEKIPHLGFYIDIDIHPDFGYIIDICKDLPISLEFIFEFDSFNKNSHTACKAHFISINLILNEKTLFQLKSIFERRECFKNKPLAFTFNITSKVVSYLNDVLEFLSDKKYFVNLLIESEELKHLTDFEFDNYSVMFDEVTRSYRNDEVISIPVYVNYKELVSFYVSPAGYICPSEKFKIFIGDINKKSLDSILSNSEFFKDLREYKKLLKKPCRACEYRLHCFGSREIAYAVTGDFLASDPFCCLNLSNKKEIYKLPVNVGDLIPHGHPMHFVDTLNYIGDGECHFTYQVPMSSPYINDEGILDEAVYLEIAAQSVALYKGFKIDLPSEKLTKGLLIGCSDFNIYRSVKSGEKLFIKSFKNGYFAGFSIIDTKIFAGEDVVAEGSIKIWHQDDEYIDYTESKKNN